MIPFQLTLTPHSLRGHVNPSRASGAPQLSALRAKGLPYPSTFPIVRTSGPLRWWCSNAWTRLSPRTGALSSWFSSRTHHPGTTLLLHPSETPKISAVLTQNHFWWTVVPGSHNSGVVLVIKGSTSKVCHTDACVPNGFLLTALQVNKKSSVLLVAGSGSS